jgi:hypothetical protein
MQHLPSALGFIAPVRVAAVAFVSLALLLVVAPVVVDVSFSVASVFMLLACIAGLFGGLALASPGRPPPAALTAAPGPGWDRLARQIIGIGTVGVVLLALDRYVARGLDLRLDLFEARMALEQAEGGPLSLVAALLSSFVLFGPVAAWLAAATGRPLPRLLQGLAWAALGVYLVMSAALGSRSLVLVCALLYLFAFGWFRGLSGTRIRARHVAGVLLGGVGLVGLLAGLLLHRLGLMGLSAIDSIQLSVYAYTLKPSSDLLAFLEANEDLGAAGAAAYSVLVYVLHGSFEFLVRFDEFRGPHTDGVLTLWLPLKVLSYLLPLPEAPDLDTFDGVRTGVFTTFAGPALLDAGLAAPALLMAKFFLLALPFRLLALGDLRWLFAALQVAVILALSPMIDLLDSATGAYPLVAALLIGLMAPRQFRRSKAAPASRCPPFSSRNVS